MIKTRTYTCPCCGHEYELWSPVLRYGPGPDDVTFDLCNGFDWLNDDDFYPYKEAIEIGKKRVEEAKKRK